MRKKRNLIQSNYVQQLLSIWKEENPSFIQNGHISKELYANAVQSFVTFLRIKKLSLIECQIELNKESPRSTYISIYASMLISWLFGFAGCCLSGESIWISIVAFLISLLVIGVSFVKDLLVLSNNSLSDNGFIQISLQNYISLYENAICVENKLVELYNKKLTSVPSSAAILYSERMQLAKYYQNAFIITVNNNGQKFNYVLYSNSDNCSPANFIRLCKEQIGKSWNGINKEQIVIAKASVIPGA